MCAFILKSMDWVRTVCTSDVIGLLWTRQTSSASLPEVWIRPDRQVSNIREPPILIWLLVLAALSSEWRLTTTEGTWVNVSSPGKFHFSYSVKTLRISEPIPFLFLTGVYFRKVRFISRQTLRLSEAGLGPAQAFEGAEMSRCQMTPAALLGSHVASYNETHFRWLVLVVREPSVTT